MRSFYDLMKKSEVMASDGTPYPDMFTLPTNDFVFNTVPVQLSLSTQDLQRPDIMLSRQYGYTDLYDLVFQINGIGYPKDVDEGFMLKFPSQNDLETFYAKNR